MAKTKVLKAPYHPVSGSLLHYPGDGRAFSHYVSDAGERLERSDIWQTTSENENGRIEKVIRHDWKLVYTEPEWRDNVPFYAALQIDSMSSGRSAKYVILTHITSVGIDFRTYPMFVADLIDLSVRRGIDKGGFMHGTWMVAKRGANYGLRAAKEDE